jgi:hypothetical protein
MPARIVEAIADQVADALPPHIAEGHWWTMFDNMRQKVVVSGQANR